MDTRFWGPSAWCLFHLIAAEKRHSDPKAVATWFGLMEFVLPCKFCRASFHDYIELQPLTAVALTNRDKMSRWMYDIHNRVNGKLRGQGLLTKPNPTWSSIRERYLEKLRKIEDGTDAAFVGWDFLSSIANSTPARDYKIVPMPNADEISEKDNIYVKNRYNLLTRQERLKILALWWMLIPAILPSADWRVAWSAAIEKFGAAPLTGGKAAMMNWIWRLEESVCGSLKCPTPHSSCQDLKSEVGAFESDCGKKVKPKSKTCRSQKSRVRSKVMTKRALRIAQRTQTPFHSRLTGRLSSLSPDSRSSSSASS